MLGKQKLKIIIYCAISLAHDWKAHRSLMPKCPLDQKNPVVQKQLNCTAQNLWNLFSTLKSNIDILKTKIKEKNIKFVKNFLSFGQISNLNA